MRYRVFIILASVFLASCYDADRNEGFDITRGEAVNSRSGHEAYIVETKSYGDYQTQVLIRYRGGQCGSGVANADGIYHNLILSWINDETLEITKPRSLELNQNASGSKVQCGEYVVDIVIKNA